MKHYRSSSSKLERESNRRRRVLGIKGNTPIQWVLVFLITCLLLIYSGAMIWQFSKVLAITEHNTQTVYSDFYLEDVDEFEVQKDGSVIITLLGGQQLVKDAEFVFVSSEASHLAYYSREDNILVVPMSADFALNFLTGNKYFMVLIFSVVFTAVLFLIKKREWAVLSLKRVRVLMVILTLMIVMSGGIVFLCT